MHFSMDTKNPNTSVKPQVQLARVHMIMNMVQFNNIGMTK